ncbi:MAG: thiamine phosphate synthase [Gemmatimonadales bacterium]
MRPLPRVLAFADQRIAAIDDLGVRAAAIAAAGPAVALVARLPDGSIDALTALALRFRTLAAPPMATVLVTGRTDIARAVGTHGVILRSGDLDVSTARSVLSRSNDRTDPVTPAFVIRSVHTEAEANAARDEGADALVVGNVWASATHPDRPAAGTALLERIVSLGVPTFAIGGVTPERARLAKAAGAWGVAAISAVWNAPHPYHATLGLLGPWLDILGE